VLRDDVSPRSPTQEAQEPAKPSASAAMSMALWACRGRRDGVDELGAAGAGRLVGPYTRYGQPVIEACVDAGCHYVDLSGEIPFVRRMNAAFDARARAAGVKIVQVCGFEALPPDLGIALAGEAAAEAGEHLVEMDLEVRIVEQPMPPRVSERCPVAHCTASPRWLATQRLSASLTRVVWCLIRRPPRWLASAARSASALAIATAP
jgi:hypothetical protein